MSVFSPNDKENYIIPLIAKLKRGSGRKTMMNNICGEFKQKIAVNMKLGLAVPIQVLDI